jgi:UDP-glucose 4-epimerase
LSTADLVRVIASAVGKPARLLPVPSALMRLAGNLSGKRAQVDRLLGSLAVDISKNRELLGWVPPVSVEKAMAETTEWYLSEDR